jgi:2'-5' RNA ligase
MDAPLILTLLLDDASQAFFDSARKRWFPPKLNFIRAHVTLCHHLPGDQLEPIRDHLALVCARQKTAEVSVTGVRSLGRGVAYCLRAPEIEALRAVLAARWRDELTVQDRQGWRPHVTVQNKVTPAQARDLLGEVSRAFVPFSVTATGLALWWYRGGPWESAATVPFGG